MVVNKHRRKWIEDLSDDLDYIKERVGNISVKAQYDESDTSPIDVSAHTPLTKIRIRNKSGANPLTVTINDISMVIATETVEEFDYCPFEEIEWSGTAPDFDLYVFGVFE